MPENKNPEYEVTEIEEVRELEKANEMLRRRRWIYLGFYRERVVHNLGEEPRESPVFLLGRP